MTQFFHYTDDQGAKKIIRSGRVLASLKTNGDAAFGNGVYLTKLNPGSSTRAEVAQNNWLNNSDHFRKKTKNVFVLEIPDNKVKNVSTETRNIFMFGGRKDLRLVKYKWYLQDFDTGKILASHKYHFGSTGPAVAASSIYRRLYIGDYVMTERTVNGRPVYKNRFLWQNHFLFMSSYGNWVVGRNTDKDSVWLKQKGEYNLVGPDVEGVWDYLIYDSDAKASVFKGDDATLKAYPWHKDSQWKTVTATSSNMPDPTNDNGLQSSGTTRSGRIDGGPPEKTTGLRRRLAAMFQ